MKKSYHALICSILLVFPLLVRSQCVPDSSVNALYAPDLVQGLPDGAVTVPYEATITLNVPVDTTYLTLTAVIDSMVLTDVTGLPDGFTWDCSPSSCGFPGGERGCIRITGFTEDNAQAGTWDIDAEFLFYIKTPAVTLPYIISGYSITLDSVALSSPQVRTQNLRYFVEPNPVNPSSKLVFDLPSAGRYAVEIYSLLGNRVGRVEADGKQGENNVRLADFTTDAGVYFIALSQGDYTRSMRFIVQ
jgi:hypothetical protein